VRRSRFVPRLRRCPTCRRGARSRAGFRRRHPECSYACSATAHWPRHSRASRPRLLRHSRRRPCRELMPPGQIECQPCRPAGLRGVSADSMAPPHGTPAPARGTPRAWCNANGIRAPEAADPGRASAPAAATGQDIADMLAALPPGSEKPRSRAVCRRTCDHPVISPVGTCVRLGWIAEATTIGHCCRGPVAYAQLPEPCVALHVREADRTCG
jgi:hypothetical protein